MERKPKVEKATFSETFRKKEKAAASADVMSDTCCRGSTFARASVSVMVPLPSLEASAVLTKRSVLLPESSVSKKKTVEFSH